MENIEAIEKLKALIIENNLPKPTCPFSASNAHTAANRIGFVSWNRLKT